MWTELCPKPKGAVELGRNVAQMKTRLKCGPSWSSDWNIHCLTVSATESNVWPPESHRSVILRDIKHKETCTLLKNRSNLRHDEGSLKLLMLVWRKAYSMEIIQITMNEMDPASKEELCSRYCCTLICTYTHQKDPSLQMKAWTRKVCVGKKTFLPRDNSTLKSHCARQHL